MSFLLPYLANVYTKLNSMSIKNVFQLLIFLIASEPTLHIHVSCDDFQLKADC